MDIKYALWQWGPTAYNSNSHLRPDYIIPVGNFSGGFIARDNLQRTLQPSGNAGIQQQGQWEQLAPRWQGIL